MNPMLLPSAAFHVSPVFGVPLEGSSVGQGPSAGKINTNPDLPSSSSRYVEQDRRHRGVAGVSRDILGTLGDFLLTRLGLPAMYGPAQQNRRESAAMQGFEQDPMSAINRLESINPEAGRRLREQHIDNTRIAAGQDATNEARNSRIELARQETDRRIRGYASSMLGSMSGWDEDRRRQNYPQMRAQVLRAAERQGLDLSSELPETYDPVSLDAFIDASVPVGMQRSQRLTRERMDQQQDQFEQRDSTTRRGQDINSNDRAASRDVTRRGQDIGSADRRRGQDINSRDRTSDRQERDRLTRRIEERPGRFTPDPNRIYVQNGRRYRYNAQTRTYELVN